MDISYFREFAVLAETRNFWAASEKLYIGQSSLSKHIKTLEAQLGAPLFERTSRKVALTPFGREMLPFAQSIARLQQEYEAAASLFLHGKRELLRIAAFPSLGAYHLTDLLLQFKEKNTSIELDIQEIDSIHIEQQLLSAQAEIGIRRISSGSRDSLTDIPVATDRLVAVLSRDHPLSSSSQLRLEQLRGESFAFLEKNSMPYLLCQAACKDAGFMPKVVYCSQAIDSILSTVKRKNCVALLFEKQILSNTDFMSEQSLPYAVIPLLPERSTTVSISFCSDRELSPAASDFISLVLDHKTERSKL